MPFLFLSPSTQEYNPYVTSGNEEYWMNRLADRMVPYLEASGINVTRNDPNGTVGDSIRASNAGNYDFHLALHSNAAPASVSGQVRGIDIYYYTPSLNGLRMANIIVDNLKEIYPLPSRVRAIGTVNIAEVRMTKAPAVLAELGYHDNTEDALWVENNLEAIARSLSLSVTEYFGLPLLSPRPSREGVVMLQSGTLNLRGAPSTSGPILASIPNGEAVTILGSYNGWYSVNYDGLIGWANGAFLQSA